MHAVRTEGGELVSRLRREWAHKEGRGFNPAPASKRRAAVFLVCRAPLR
jgi:hypothetical protein